MCVTLARQRDGIFLKDVNCPLGIGHFIIVKNNDWQQFLCMGQGDVGNPLTWPEIGADSISLLPLNDGPIVEHIPLLPDKNDMVSNL